MKFFLCELFIYVSTVVWGPEIALLREKVEWVHRRALLVFNNNDLLQQRTSLGKETTDIDSRYD